MVSPSVITILTGPTASGKTSVSLFLAALLNAEIINADSRQVYRGFDIGTAKLTREERALIPHHGIDVCEANDAWTAGDFFRKAQIWLRDITSRGKRTLVVGGSGLYIRALTDGIFESPPPDPVLRGELQQRLHSYGLSHLLDELHKRDPEIMQTIDKNNPVRVLRALEVCLQSNVPYSQLRRERMPKIPYRFVLLGLEWERQQLYARINARVHEMIQSGFVTEVAGLLKAGVDPGCQAMQSLGYQEIYDHISRSSGIAETVKLIQQLTRNFAKRQLTWFRRESRMNWVPAVGEAEKLAVQCADYVLRKEMDADTSLKE